MTKPRPSPLESLRKLQQQRAELDQREADLRQQAAAELGQVLLDCGAETLEPRDLKDLLKSTMRLGPKAAIERLAG